MAEDYKALKTTLANDDARLIAFKRKLSRIDAGVAKYNLTLVRQWDFQNPKWSANANDDVEYLTTQMDGYDDGTVSNPQADKVEYTGTWEVVRTYILDTNSRTSDRNSSVRQVLHLKDAGMPYTATYAESCLITVEVDFYWDLTKDQALTIIDALSDTATVGTTVSYRLGGENEDGLVDLQIIRRISQAYESDGNGTGEFGDYFTILEAQTRTTSLAVKLNQTAIELPNLAAINLPADSIGTVYAQTARKNPDCTWDLNIEKRVSTEYGPKTTIYGTEGYREQNDISANLRTIPSPGQGSTGITNTVSASINQDGTVDANNRKRTAVALGPSSVKAGTVGVENQVTVAENAAAMPSDNIGGTGVTTSISPSINIDGTINYQETQATVTPLQKIGVISGTVGFTDTEKVGINQYAYSGPGAGATRVTNQTRFTINQNGTIDYAESSRESVLQSQSFEVGTLGYKESLDVSRNATVLTSIARGSQGITTSVSPTINVDGTVDFRLVNRQSYPVIRGPSKSGTIGYEESITSTINDSTFPNPGQSSTDGVTNSVSMSISQDGTVQHVVNQRTASEVTHDERILGTLYRKETIDFALNTDRNSATTNPGQGTQGITWQLSPRLNQNGTVDWQTRKIESVYSGEKVVVEGTVGYTDTQTKNVNALYVFNPGPGAQGITWNTDFRMNEDGTFDNNFTQRVVTAQDETVTNTYSSVGRSVTRLVARDQYTAPTVPGSPAVVGTTVDINHTINPDGTFGFNKQTVVVNEQDTGWLSYQTRYGTAQFRHIKDAPIATAQAAFNSMSGLYSNTGSVSYREDGTATGAFRSVPVREAGAADFWRGGRDWYYYDKRTGTLNGETVAVETFGTSNYALASKFIRGESPYNAWTSGGSPDMTTVMGAFNINLIVGGDAEGGVRTHIDVSKDNFRATRVTITR